MKTLQILMVVAAVLCAVGIAATFGRGQQAMPDNFEPPGWVQSLAGLGGGPRLERTDLTRNGQPFPSDLRLNRGQEVRFSVAPSDADIRRAVFDIRARRNQVIIQYRPDDAQELDVPAEDRVQRWPTADRPDAEPAFVIYDLGGTLTVQARLAPASIRLEE